MSPKIKTPEKLHFFSPSSSSLKTGILIHVILILLQMATGVMGIRINELKVPRPGVIGRSATLECNWDTEGQEFYSIRWYKNNEEFYSFTKGNMPMGMNHRIAGVNVDLKLSDDRKVTISEVTADTDGEYQCEVMTRTFDMDSLLKKFSVVKMPDTPEILGLKPSYKHRDLLNVTCMARHANPPASIMFLINDEPVDPHSKKVKDMGQSYEYRKGTYTTGARLYLRFDTPGRYLQLTCIASIQTVEVKASRKIWVEPSGGATITPVSLLIVLLMCIALIMQSLW